MRAERLSCVRNDGSVLESSLDAYASGEDGKAGIRGRLVSKQGQILARSLMAGFMQGVAGAFDVRQVPSINITRSGNNDDDVQSPVYEQAFDQNAIQAAGVGGVGSALERIADFYLEMAENIFPVIEIDAMREVDFIVKKGMTVKFNETTLKVSQTN
ncbi:Bacterial conjugation TrbI-like protein [compost metagenome]